uniref:Amino acid transporter n=1 Tax=Thermogemmatispora argillosa TaxID=2045280 RepID=A0A455SZ83_9CHLR|nr:amino acid transporter [Thermogemmatispora argillosa]
MHMPQEQGRFEAGKAGGSFHSAPLSPSAHSLATKEPAEELESEEREAWKGTLPSESYVPRVMPRLLSTGDMVATFLMIVFFITNATTAVAGGAAAFTYWAIGALAFFIPGVIATAQLGVIFPHEGSLYNWTHKAFGGYWSFFAAFCAWFPGVLVIISAGDVIVSYLQGLNPGWLTEPWQQGLFIIGLIAVTSALAIQRYSAVQKLVNLVAGLTLVAVMLLGLAGLVWLLRGHPSATSFSHLSDWSIRFDKNSGNLYLFGLITLAYLGTEVPLNMGGEVARLRAITRHLFWGALLVIVGYGIATFALLVIAGPQNGAAPFALVHVVDLALGKFMGNVVAFCLMSFFIMAMVVYNYAYARLLMVAGIDQRLPVKVARLNRQRVPANAIIFQAAVATVVTAFVFLLAPYTVQVTTPANLSTEVYNVMLASSTLVWAFSAGFLFFNLIRLHGMRHPLLRERRIVPAPLLWGSVLCGSVACFLAIIGTLFYSWTNLISNTQWFIIISVLTFAYLVIAAIGSMFANSEANWESARL